MKKPSPLVQAAEKPVVKATPEEMKVVDKALELLPERDEIYQRGGALVQIVREQRIPGGIVRPSSAPKAEVVKSARVREVLSDAARWANEEGKEIHPPNWVVDNLIARRHWPGLRILEGIVESPVLRPDGTIVASPEYDEATGLYLELDRSFPPVPDEPDRDAAINAIEQLLEVVIDFPFASPAHRAAWLAGLLTVLARFAYEAPAPLFLIDANVRGSGKSLLADVISMIALGRTAARMAPCNNPEEERKRITALTIAGDPLILIDNIVDGLGSPALDAALTGKRWTDRVLGHSMRIDLPLDAIWMATGNNTILRGDMTRRVLPIRLLSNEEYPEHRDGFRHPELLKWVAKERPRLVVAALTVLRGFVVAGRPKQGLVTWGSFEGWSSLIRDALVWAGQPDPGETRETLQSESDRERDLLERLISGMQAAIEKTGNAKLTSADVLRVLEEEGAKEANEGPSLDVLRSAVDELCGTSEQLPSSRVLGSKLRSYKDRVVGGRALRSGGRTSYGMTWTIETIASFPAGADLEKRSPDCADQGTDLVPRPEEKKQFSQEVSCD